MSAAALSGAQAGPDGFRVAVSGFTGLTAGQGRTDFFTDTDKIRIDNPIENRMPLPPPVDHPLAEQDVQMAGNIRLSQPDRFHDLMHGFERLRLPRLMVAIISLMYRYLAVLTDEASRMMRARAARSAALPGAKRPSVRWQASVVGNMVGALFLRSYERSERVYVAMQARGYDGTMVRHEAPPLGLPGFAAIGSVAVALAAFELVAFLWLPRP